MNAYIAKTAHTTKAQRRSRVCYLDAILLSAADRNRAGGCLLHKINNYTLKGDFKFPATLTEVLAIINNYS